MTQSVLHLVVASIQAGLALSGIHVWRRFRRPYTLIVVVVLAGLTYDNAILGLGRWLGHGSLLESLSVPRFVLHAFTTPLLIIAGLGAARAAQQAWAHTSASRVALWALTAAMVVWGVVGDIVLLDLETQTEAGVVSYGNAAAGLPIPAIVTILALIVTGISVWRARGWPWLAVGALVMFVASGLGAVSALLTNVGELVLVTSLVATETAAGRWANQSRPSRFSAR